MPFVLPFSPGKVNSWTFLIFCKSANFLGGRQTDKFREIRTINSGIYLYRLVYVRGIRWQVKQIMFPGSRGITQGINVNGKPHDLAVASERLHFKSNWHGPGLEVAGNGGDAATWYPCMKADCFSLCLFLFFLSPFLQGVPEAPAAEVYSACKDGHKAGLNVEKHFWQYLLGHYDQCQTLSSVALNSIKV